MKLIFYILCALLFLKVLSRRIRGLKIYFLKKEIEKNPLKGIKDLDGTYLYKKNGYALRYNLKELNSEERQIQWLSCKSRLTAPEKFIYEIKIIFQRFLLYSHLKPSLAHILFLIIIIAYIWILIPEPKKGEFYKSMLSRAIGVKPEQIEYKGEGWFEVSGKRVIPEDNRSEPLTFTINPFHWLFFSDYGSVTRWRGKDFGGYKTHELKVERERGVSTGQAKRDIHGEIEGDEVRWDRPLGTGSTTQDIETEKEGIRIIDR